MKNILLAFLGSFFPAILFNINRKNLIWAGLSGSCGWIAFSLVKTFSGHTILAAFAGGMAVSLYSEIMARVLKCPAFIFSISGIFPLVPGIGAYNTVLFLVKRQYSNAAESCLETLGMAGSIAFGIIFITTLFLLYSDYKWKKKIN